MTCPCRMPHGWGKWIDSIGENGAEVQFKPRSPFFKTDFLVFTEWSLRLILPERG